MAAFDLALSRVRDGSDDLLVPARINQLARAGGHVFRRTTLTPGNTLRLFAQQIACGNIACSAVHHLAGEAFSDAAWCQARQRLPIELIEQVHRVLVDETRRELVRRMIREMDRIAGAVIGCTWSMAAPIRCPTHPRFARITACPRPAARGWDFPRRI